MIAKKKKEIRRPFSGKITAWIAAWHARHAAASRVFATLDAHRWFLDQISWDALVGSERWVDVERTYKSTDR